LLGERIARGTLDPVRDKLVLAECAADPDADAPRLVWADLIGGERGELVVLQCDLARGELPSSEAAARRRRARELLDRHGVAWAGSLAACARRWSFSRGFLEAARIDLADFDPGTLADQPLLSSLAVESWDLPEHADALLAILGRLRALRLDPMPFQPRDPVLLARVSRVGMLAQLARTPAAGGLRGFAVEAVDPQEVADVRAIVRHAALDELWLDHHRLSAGELETVLEAAAELSALRLTGHPIAGHHLGVVRDRPLRALRLGALTRADVETLAGSAASRSIACLGFDTQDAALPVAELLERMPLHTLELGGSEAAIRRALSAELPGLRVLRVRGELRHDLVNELVDRWGAQLERLELSSGAIGGERRARIAGELVNAPAGFSPGDRTLLHPSSPLGLAPEPACAWRSEPAVLAWSAPRPDFCEIPALPIDERVVFGRGSQLAVRIDSPHVARWHGALYWRGDYHELRWLGGTNGIVRAGEWLEIAALVDGDELVCGDVVVRYFIGPGARERAEAACARWERTGVDER
jgi:hypothetical protein